MNIAKLLKYSFFLGLAASASALQPILTEPSCTTANNSPGDFEPDFLLINKNTAKFYKRALSKNTKSYC